MGRVRTALARAMRAMHKKLVAHLVPDQDDPSAVEIMNQLEVRGRELAFRMRQRREWRARMAARGREVWPVPERFEIDGFFDEERDAGFDELFGD